ncbi:MAG: excinuclease ABC subunit UvrC [Arsenophonus sp. ET-KM2-MAG3]
MLKLFEPKKFLQTVVNQPGVYRMYNTSGKVIYVGKAKDLKKRLATYFRAQITNRKTEQLVKNIAQIDVTITDTETEALLLEHNYIKLYQPRYNVLLKDDKSYPYIFLSADKHPRLAIYRGTMKVNGDYFGPFPNIYAVKETLILLQKLFPLRQCENSAYRNRSRVCLKYHINRCLGPCIKGLVTDKEYQQQVECVRLFLLGKDKKVLEQLSKNMKEASQKLNFESAANYRDQIQAVRTVTEQQFITSNTQNLDIISIAYNLSITCIHILFIRQGKVLGSRNYYPIIPVNTQLNEVVRGFLSQFYLENNKIDSLPEEILLDFFLEEKTILANFLTKKAKREIKIQIQPHEMNSKLLNLARTNAKIALEKKISEQSTIHKRMQALSSFFGLKKISRIECFDVSHTSGQQTVASCIVFNNNGPLYSEYRCYNIIDITPGDDCSAMYQVLTKHYNKHIDESKVPDLIFIDGGKGQLAKAFDVFKTLNVNWDTCRPKLIGVAKGHARKTGLETLFLKPNGEGFSLPSDSPALHLIQNIRDESHNYAISEHRKRRAKIKNTSILNSIKGIGPKRHKILLKYIRGLQALRNASINEIRKLPTISYTLAEKIFNVLK